VNQHITSSVEAGSVALVALIVGARLFIASLGMHTPLLLYPLLPPSSGILTPYPARHWGMTRIMNPDLLKVGKEEGNLNVVLAGTDFWLCR